MGKHSETRLKTTHTHTQTSYRFLQLSVQFLTSLTMEHNIDLATRAMVVCLKTSCNGKTTAEVATLTGLPPNTINNIYANAIARGFDPNKIPLDIQDCHFEDGPPN